MAVQRFPIRIGQRSRPLLRLFGVREGNAWVDVPDDRSGDLISRFGFFGVRIPIATIASYRIEGPWRWITAIGVRRSVRGGDVSFAGSPHGGVRIDLSEPAPFFFLRPPAWSFAADDLEGLAEALERLGIRGTDRRTGARPPSAAGS